MIYYEVAKTIYLNNGDDEYFKYEIVEDENGEVCFAMAFIEVRVVIDDVSMPVWSKLENISLDHLMPSKRGAFQTEMRNQPYPGKSIATAITVCKEHRKNYQ
ncbi:hypothetical protein [Atlantibacter sp.]|uniref:hypothetical protein n=1 Tax=Atlantibacter sp. TaxID=1903473 RepID=UPI00289E00E5|nr:hypothetical protein [Atlantibacter sp.]